MTKASLQQFVVEEWNKLIADGTTVRNLIAGVANKCDEVIKAGGAIC
jgi:hypothetical protein